LRAHRWSLSRDQRAGSEQFDRIPVRILDLDLATTGTGFHHRDSSPVLRCLKPFGNMAAHQIALAHPGPRSCGGPLERTTIIGDWFPTQPDVHRGE
jgi:hypothetical protein